jgi:hypothetical protein
MLPVATTSPATGRLIINAVAALNIGVPVEIIVVVYRDIVIAAPPAVVAPAPGPHRAHGHSHTERNGHSCCVVTWRWIVDRRIRIDRWPVDHRGVIRGYINDFGVGLLDDNDLLRFHDLGLDFLLFVGFEIAFFFGLCPHPLHCVHYVILLRQKCVA